jgi:hydrogenase nickel incorporation protein HypB
METREQIDVSRPLLAANQGAARRVRMNLIERGVLAVNLLGGPGTGKTSLCEAMGRKLGDALAVVAGDVATERDAERLRRAGVQSVAITTCGRCHLDASMVETAIAALEMKPVRILIIENVGNLVCPASFDLGETFKAVMLSVAEGDDKPLKYPAVFARSEALLINKLDLRPHCPDFDPMLARANARKSRPGLSCFNLSCRTGEGIEHWLEWLLERAQADQAEAVTIRAIPPSP